MQSVILLNLIGVIFFATNDSLRDTFPSLQFFSKFKDLIVFSLFFLAVIISKKSMSRIEVGFYTVALIFLIVAAFTTANNQYYFPRSEELYFGGWSIWVRALELFLLTFSLTQVNRYNSYYFNIIPKIYITFVLFFGIISLLSVSGIAFGGQDRNWYGRFSIGYPPLDSFVLVSGVLFAHFQVKSNAVSIPLQLFFISLIFLQNTLIGYLLLLSYGLFLFVLFPIGKKLILIFLFLFVLVSASFLYVNFADYGTYGILFVDKVRSLLFGEQTSSVTLRVDQISYLLDFMFENPLSFIFGAGGNAAFSVESTPFSVLAFFGIGGILFYYGIILYSIKLFLLKSDFLGFSIAIALLLSSLPLVAIYLYPLIFSWAFIVVRAYQPSPKVI